MGYGTSCRNLMAEPPPSIVMALSPAQYGRSEQFVPCFETHTPRESSKCAESTWWWQDGLHARGPIPGCGRSVSRRIPGTRPWTQASAEYGRARRRSWRRSFPPQSRPLAILRAADTTQVIYIGRTRPPPFFLLGWAGHARFEEGRRSGMASGTPRRVTA